jgi:hypothetical protein
VLLYELPTKRNTERVNIWRKLKKFGALALKTSAYVLPDDAAQYERFQWLSTQIRDAAGEATLIRVAQIEGVPNSRLVQMFNEARAADYKELGEAMRRSLAGKRVRHKNAPAPELEKYQRRFNEIQEVDYFKSSAGHDALRLLHRVEKPPAAKGIGAAERLDPAKFTGRSWVTRPRPGIDRAGSAWLIRRFIDAKARFVFAMDPAKHPKALPFDMAEVEFSHHGDDCTFETLVKRFAITDKAVLKMAEMVHDADLEDEKFQRDECRGINAVLSGWARTNMTDAELLAKGMECFDGLYQGLRK